MDMELRKKLGNAFLKHGYSMIISEEPEAAIFTKGRVQLLVRQDGDTVWCTPHWPHCSDVTFIPDGAARNKFQVKFKAKGVTLGVKKVLQIMGAELEPIYESKLRERDIYRSKHNADQMLFEKLWSKLRGTPPKAGSISGEPHIHKVSSIRVVHGKTSLCLFDLEPHEAMAMVDLCQEALK